MSLRYSGDGSQPQKTGVRLPRTHDGVLEKLWGRWRRGVRRLSACGERAAGAFAGLDRFQKIN